MTTAERAWSLLQSAPNPDDYLAVVQAMLNAGLSIREIGASALGWMFDETATRHAVELGVTVAKAEGTP